MFVAIYYVNIPLNQRKCLLNMICWTATALLVVNFPDIHDELIRDTERWHLLPKLTSFLCYPFLYVTVFHEYSVNSNTVSQRDGTTSKNANPPRFIAIAGWTAGASIAALPEVRQPWNNESWPLHGLSGLLQYVLH